jgi:hypothetical protein
MARMTDDSEWQRAEVEDALAVLARARLLLRAQVRFRLRQAVERDALLGDLLRPAMGQLDDIDDALTRAQGVLSADWRAGNVAGWRRGGK